MSFEKFGTRWWRSSSASAVDPEHFNDLAHWCETLGPADQRLGFDRVLREIDAPGDGSGHKIDREQIAQLVLAGAYESAAVAMIPQSAMFSGGRMKDGSFVAQFIPEGHTGAHSRNARSLAMAWLAALLRAMARQAAEAKRLN